MKTSDLIIEKDARYKNGEGHVWFQDEIKHTEDSVSTIRRSRFYYLEDGTLKSKMNRRVFTNQKFLCIGGPLSGQKHEYDPDKLKGYTTYNRGEGDKTPTSVFLHKSLFNS